MDAEGHGQEDAGQAVRREHELGEQSPFRTERQRDIAPDQGGGCERIQRNCNRIVLCII